MLRQIIFGIVFPIIVFSSANAALVKKDLEYNIAGRPYMGYLVYDDASKGTRPGLLVAHDWMGVTAETKSKADAMATLGYVVFATDVYGKDRRPTDAKEAGAIAGTFSKDRFLLRSHMQDGLAQLIKQPNVDKKKVAAIGYCFGGTAALELGRAGADIKGIVTFHGSLDSPSPADGKRIKGKVLALQGADDPYVSKENLNAFEKELRDAKVSYKLVKYPGAVHSFTNKGAGNDNSKGAAYNAEADMQSWVAMQDFLKTIFN